LSAQDLTQQFHRDATNTCATNPEQCHALPARLWAKRMQSVASNGWAFSPHWQLLPVRDK